MHVTLSDDETMLFGVSPMPDPASGERLPAVLVDVFSSRDPELLAACLADDVLIDSLATRNVAECEDVLTAMLWVWRRSAD
ncbi:hypothetical protein LWC33_24080 [Pseudonocardia sp. RS11V-5]|uniref:hypothetical protein n=1 Tax=Pseudonocardia terrae TaxID=2905831 RepID=UPI001E60C282|nr:hypothetical protein [Pseudonocardia terrae]MCE3554524.1 hypothetical protein [Pseudonocardia terrae]